MAHLDIFSDVACPWCFIGKRRLESALAQLPDDERPAIRWHAYQLQPDFPEGQSKPALPWLAAKFGGEARMRPMIARVAAVGHDVGIAFDFEQQQAVNTRLAHRAVVVARQQGQESAAVEALFAAHFEHGKDLSNPAALAAILEPAGVVDLVAQLAAGVGDDDVDADQGLAAGYGITGVPFFILDDEVALSGAQEPATFREFLAAGKKPTPPG